MLQGDHMETEDEKAALEYYKMMKGTRKTDLDEQEERYDMCSPALIDILVVLPMSTSWTPMMARVGLTVVYKIFPHLKLGKSRYRLC